MTLREVIRCVLEGGKPPYVPWSCSFTQEARATLARHYGTQDLDRPLGNHLLKLGSDIGFFEDLGTDRVRDVFGVVWNRSLDKDIGIVEGCVLPEPTLAGYRFPDPLDPGSLLTSQEGSPPVRTPSACSRSGSPFTNVRGRCAEWRT